LKLLAGGAGRSLDGEFDRRFPEPGTWAADKRAVQRHGVDLLTISLLSG
jgi:CO dehydrogenase/acetyl-CoA synthase delta subunit